MNFSKKLISTVIISTIIFLFLVSINISPFIRGPGEWPPDWRWPYLFINTTNKIWVPLLITVLILIFAYLIEKRTFKNKSFLLLFSAITLSYLFQLSIVYFSRSNIFVLIHRIINPDLNGYFTEGMKINSLILFLKNYQGNVLNFSMHATGHPPGGIMFFWLIEKFFKVFTFFNDFISNISPKHQDIQIIWNTLSSSEKLTALFTAYLIPLLGSFNIIPLYLIANEFFNLKTSIRVVFLATFIPSLTLFTPLSDVIFPIFFLYSFYFFIKGINKNNSYLILLSGLIFSLGLFFSLSLLPLLLIYLYFLIRKKNINFFLFFIIGLVIFYLILFIFKYNVFTVSYTLMTGLPKNRTYFSWIFYNLYDFFVFAGIPVTTIYLTMLIKKVKEPLFYSFTLMLIILNFSGLVRGEVGRIWLPFMFPLILVISNYIVNKIKLTTKHFLIILFLQALQIIVLQEFWVTLW